MARSHSFWMIADGAVPTAFRGKTREELLPTLHQLQRTQPNVAIYWFERGRTWASPTEAREEMAMRRRLARERKPDWRPGGSHADPRAKYQLTRDQKRARFKKRSDFERRSASEESSGPPRERPPDRKPWPARDDRPARPWKPKPATGTGSTWSKPRGPWKPAGPGRKPGGFSSKPSGPWKPSGPRKPGGPRTSGGSTSRPRGPWKPRGPRGPKGRP